MKESIWVKILRTKKEGTWGEQWRQWIYNLYRTLKNKKQEKELHKKKEFIIILTWFAFNVLRKLPRLFTIPCQWAIRACWAAALVIERDDPFTEIALDVLGACHAHQRSKLFMKEITEISSIFVKFPGANTCIHNPSKGEISFLRLSRIIPYIFST